MHSVGRWTGEKCQVCLVCVAQSVGGIPSFHYSIGVMRKILLLCSFDMGKTAT